MGNMCYNHAVSHMYFGDKPEMEVVKETKDLFAKVYTVTVIS